MTKGDETRRLAGRQGIVAAVTVTHHLDRNQELAGVDTLLDLLDDPEDDPRLVLQRTSELVGSLVDSTGEELGEQISVGGVCVMNTQQHKGDDTQEGVSAS
jgi:site-specific recombinase